MIHRDYSYGLSIIYTDYHSYGLFIRIIHYYIYEWTLLFIQIIHLLIFIHTDYPRKNISSIHVENCSHSTLSSCKMGQPSYKLV